MSSNWVNILATLLIVGGIGLLIEKHMKGDPQRHVPTVEEAKASVVKQLESKLGRPLTDAETDMIEVARKDSDDIIVTIHEPLTGRLKEAARQVAATAPGGQAGLPSGSGDDLSRTVDSTMQINAGNPPTKTATSQP
jgi:hypothetical protein